MHSRMNLPLWTTQTCRVVLSFIMKRVCLSFFALQRVSAQVLFVVWQCMEVLPWVIIVFCVFLWICWHWQLDFRARGDIYDGFSHSIGTSECRTEHTNKAWDGLMIPLQNSTTMQWCQQLMLFFVFDLTVVSHELLFHDGFELELWMHVSWTFVFDVRYVFLCFLIWVWIRMMNACVMSEQLCLELRSFRLRHVVSFPSRVALVSKAA